MQAYVEDYCERTGSTEYLPSTVQSTITDDNSVPHTLTASQYVEYQTSYLASYWDYIESSLDLNSDKSSAAIAAILKEAKSRAAEDAKAKALKQMGITTEAYTEYQAANSAGVSPAEDILFQAAYSSITSEKDEDGKTIPNSKTGKCDRCPGRYDVAYRRGTVVPVRHGLYVRQKQPIQLRNRPGFLTKSWPFFVMLKICRQRGNRHVE